MSAASRSAASLTIRRMIFRLLARAVGADFVFITEE